MDTHNRDGRPVDPVPFLVVAGMGTLLALSFGPGYLLALGLPLAPALGLSLAVAAGVAGWAYRRYVWLAGPAVGEVPGKVRFRRLVYGMAVFGGLLVLLALPLVSG